MYILLCSTSMYEMYILLCSTSMYEMYILLCIDVISISLLIMRDLLCLYIPRLVFSFVFCYVSLYSSVIFVQ